MALERGARLGPYEILDAIGAGGMGEVYRARDRKLDRDVAIKILPDVLATDPERIARFEREAKTLASLNHPHIAHIYGFEEVGEVRALVMELVDGPTLADRISRGPIPLDEALPVAKQVAEALEAAHERGIIHRDLKPANIKVRDDGTVKVLDFGLAKMLEGPANRLRQGSGGQEAGHYVPGSPEDRSVRLQADLSQSPTIISPAVTSIGVILGTAAYMAPEQAKGRVADKRSDIWAFGCVLYEMLTGRRAFGGDEVGDTLALVITKEPDWTVLPAAVPESVRRVLRRCLRKDSSERLHDIADVRIDIVESIAERAKGSGGMQRAPSSRARAAIALATVALLAGSLLAGSLVWFAARSGVQPQRVTKLQIAPTGAQALQTTSFESDIAITPDGSRVVYIGNHGTELFVRALDSLESTTLVKGEFRMPFISPDGQWVGFLFGGQTIRKVALTGGPPVTILTGSGGIRGATWTADNGVIFATQSPTTGLQLVSASAGEPMILTRPDQKNGELNHWWPEMLPDGRGVLFTVMPRNGGIDAAQIAVLDLRTGTYKVLLRGGNHARFVPEGYLLYGAAGTLRAIRFDLEQLTTIGASFAVVPQVSATAFGAVNAGVSMNGTLVYVPGGQPARPFRRLTWVDRQGRKTPFAVPERIYGYPRLSPDGTRVVVTSPEQEYDLWLWDIRRATLTRATFEPVQDSFPVWTPDSRRLIFTSLRTGRQTIFWQPADGTGTAEPITKDAAIGNPSAITSDGTQLIFSPNDAATGFNIMALRLDSTRRVEPLIQTPANERNADISPDRHWIAYQSDESGQYEVYVRPFPSVDSGRWQISTDGGTRPLWSHKSQELFFITPAGALMRVGFERGSTWTATTPTVVLEHTPAVTPMFASRTYDVSLDDQRFLMIDNGVDSDEEGPPTSIVVVQNWIEELKRLVPTR